MDKDICQELMKKRYVEEVESKMDDLNFEVFESIGTRVSKVEKEGLLKFEFVIKMPIVELVESPGVPVLTYHEGNIRVFNKINFKNLEKLREFRRSYKNIVKQYLDESGLKYFRTTQLKTMDDYMLPEDQKTYWVYNRGLKVTTSIDEAFDNTLVVISSNSKSRLEEIRAKFLSFFDKVSIEIN